MNENLEKMKESIYSNLERALDYVQDYVNIREVKTMEDIQQEVLDCSPTDMGEVYNDESSEDIMSFPFDIAKIKLYTYPLYNVAYHTYEGITWDISEEYETIFDNSYLYSFYKTANILLEGIEEALKDESKLKSIEYFEQLSFNSNVFVSFSNLSYYDSSLKLVEALVKRFMDQFYNFVQNYKKEGEFERYLKMWTEDFPNNTEDWKKVELYIKEQKERNNYVSPNSEKIKTIIQQTKNDYDIYRKLLNAKKIEEFFTSLPDGIIENKSPEELKQFFKTNNLKYNFKNAKVYILTKYLDFILKPFFEFKTEIKNIHPQDLPYFHYLNGAPYFADCIISLIGKDDITIRDELNQFAIKYNYRKVMPNGKIYNWGPLHIAPNVPSKEGVDLLLECLDINRNGLFMISFNFASKRYISSYF